MPLFPFSGPSKQPNTRLDTTLRPTIFAIDPNVSAEIAKQVGPEKFKRYEFTLYVMAELSRIVYCDSGIARLVIEKTLGMSSDVVNLAITAYDKYYSKERKMPISSQTSTIVQKIPMESYSLTPRAQGACWGTYISTKRDLTSIMLNVTQKFTPRLLGANSAFREGDAIVAFKGSSTAANFRHDLYSQFTPQDLGALIQSIGVKVEGANNRVPASFVKSLVDAWSVLMMGLQKHITQDDTRLFLTGHSLGGAYTTLFGFILAEGKVSGTIPIMAKVKSIHIISFGAPTLLSDTARNTFNRHLDSGLITLDRVVSQSQPQRFGAPLPGGDIIPTIPVGFTHPGYKPLATDIKPESKGRPYSIDYVRRFYGVDSQTRGRDQRTWPFSETFSKNEELRRFVQNIIGIPVPGEDPATQAQQLEELKQIEDVPPQNIQPQIADQSGGLGAQKSIYEAKTADRIPNFLSISSLFEVFAHAEYLGMFFLGAFRLPGMKNPSIDHPAFFEMCEDGMKIEYITPELRVKANGNVPEWRGGAKYKHKMRRSKTAKTKKLKRVHRKSYTRKH